ncbi:MAG: IclR family transcriptional regulator C-terminal domain-containing protein [Advenella sp.]|nr:IclR family transcriptional regulator C-terminal domain-containing protein [Advenella sp.]
MGTYLLSNIIKTDDSDKDFLTTFAKGLEVIKSFNDETPSLTVTELAQKVDISRASARRFLLTLSKLGYLNQNNSQFSLSAKILDLGYAYLASCNFMERVTPIIEQVSRDLNESCSVTVLEGREVVYIARASRSKLVSMNLQIGTRLPAYVTSTGRVHLSVLSDKQLEDFFRDEPCKKLTAHTKNAKQIIAEIKKVRDQGYCLVNQELELGMCSLAVPVYDRANQLRLALIVSCNAWSVSPEEMRQSILPVLKNAAKEITLVLP